MFGLYEVQLTTVDGKTGTLELESTPDNIFTLHALANLGILEVAVRDQGALVWSVIDPDQLPCDNCQTLIPAEIHQEELGLCVNCSSDFYNHTCDKCGEEGVHNLVPPFTRLCPKCEN